MTERVLYLLYNADGSVMGKLRYGYRKITGPKDSDPVCAACDITHGGLSLAETSSWVSVKTKIEATPGLRLVQWHRDELSPDVSRLQTDGLICELWLTPMQARSFMETEKVTYPVALYESDGHIQVVMDHFELAKCHGDAELFLEELRAKNVL